MKYAVRCALSSLAAAALAAFTAGCADELGSPQVASDITRDDHAQPTATDILEHPCESHDVAGCIALCKSKDDARSCNFAGAMVEFDREGKDDPKMAAKLYGRACSAAYYPGCNNLAWLYIGGRGVPRDTAKAMRLFFYAYDAARVSCLDGDTDGCLFAGEMVEEGRGIDRDDAQALSYYYRACAGGDTRGCELATSRR